MTCPECGNDFSLVKSKADRGQRFCSLACKMANWRELGPKNARTMTETEAAWLAALLDGEGSIGIAQRGRDADMLNYRLGIYNTSKALIDRLVEVTGITNVYQRTRQQEHHQPCYVWQVGGRDAVFLLQQVRPWLFAKAERADAALAGENFPRQPRWDRIYGKNQQTA